MSDRTLGLRCNRARVTTRPASCCRRRGRLQSILFSCSTSSYPLHVFTASQSLILRSGVGSIDRSSLQVKAALQLVGLESSNLIIGVDFTKSNEWTGKRCFDGRSLDHLSASSPNPYERAISIVSDTRSGFDEDNTIPCFGFGDMTTHDQDVFNFYGDGRACLGVPEVQRYREIAAGVRLSGPTSLAPIIKAAMGIVENSRYRYHILLIIADGQVPRCSCARCASNLEETRSENYIEERTLQALIHASHFPLSIVLVGVGDGPWDDDLMQIHDSRLRFDNFQFVDFTKIMSTEMSQVEKEEQFTFEALKKIPAQYAAIIGQQISDITLE